MHNLKSQKKKTNLREQYMHNNTDSSDDVAMRDETAIPSNEDADCFFCKGKYSEDKRGEEWVQFVSS